MDRVGTILLTVTLTVAVMSRHRAQRSARWAAPASARRYDTAANRALIDGAKVNSMITRLGGEPATLAAQNNALQADRRAHAARHPPHDQHRPAPPLPVRARRERHGGAVLAVAGAARLRRDRRHGARCGGSATSRGRSTAPSASTWRSRRRPTSRRSRDGAASTARSARTPTLAGRMVRAYVEGFQHGAQRRRHRAACSPS